MYTFWSSSIATLLVGEKLPLEAELEVYIFLANKILYYNEVIAVLL